MKPFLKSSVAFAFLWTLFLLLFLLWMCVAFQLSKEVWRLGLSHVQVLTFWLVCTCAVSLTVSRSGGLLRSFFYDLANYADTSIRHRIASSTPNELYSCWKKRRWVYLSNDTTVKLLCGLSRRLIRNYSLATRPQTQLFLPKVSAVF